MARALVWVHGQTQAPLMKPLTALHASVRAQRRNSEDRADSSSPGAILGIVIIACAGFGGMLFLPLIVSVPVSAYGIAEAAAGKYGALELIAIACSSFLLA